MIFEKKEIDILLEKLKSIKSVTNMASKDFKTVTWAYNIFYLKY